MNFKFSNRNDYKKYYDKNDNKQIHKIDLIQNCYRGIPSILA